MLLRSTAISCCRHAITLSFKCTCTCKHSYTSDAASELPSRTMLFPVKERHGVAVYGLRFSKYPLSTALFCVSVRHQFLAPAVQVLAPCWELRWASLILQEAWTTWSPRCKLAAFPSPDWTVVRAVSVRVFGCEYGSVSHAVYIQTLNP